MLERLEQIETRYEELANELSAPELLADQKAYTKAARQHRTLGEIVEKYRSWKTMKDELEELQQRERNLLSREAMVNANLDVSKANLADLNKRLDELDREISQPATDNNKKKP